MASYSVNSRAVAHARELIKSRQYVLDSDWGEVQPPAEAENAYLDSHSWDEYAEWHLGLTEGASDETKARYGFVYGDFRRIHRSGLIACHYRAAEWRHKEIERAAHDLLQAFDKATATTSCSTRCSASGRAGLRPELVPGVEVVKVLPTVGNPAVFRLEDDAVANIQVLAVSVPVLRWMPTTRSSSSASKCCSSARKVPPLSCPIRPK